jgi:hypothetical protein
VQRFSAGFAVAACSVIGSSAAAQTTVVTQISYVFPSISRVSLDAKQSLVLNRAGRAAIAGTYGITTNESNRKIVVQLDADMPSGMTLSASLGAPDGGTSAGTVPLKAEPMEVVTGIASTARADLPITYAVTSASGSSASAKRTVVFTIIAGM